MTTANTEIVVQKNIDISQEDIVHILVNEAETRLLNERDRLTTEVLNLSKKQEQADRKYVKAYQAAAEKEFGSAGKTVKKSVKDFCGVDIPMELKVRPVIETSDTTGAETLKEFEVTVDLNIRVKSGYSTDSVTLSTTETMKASADIKALKKSLDDITEKVAALSTDLARVKKEIKDIPRHERRAKAALATQTIANTEDGEKLLEQLRKTVIDGDSFLKALPSG
jgi:hypothetical protein